MSPIDFVEVNTNESPNSSVIWLHGLGADGNDFIDMVSTLRLPSKLGIRFIFPHAPVQPVSLNGGYPMRSWFDIFGLDESSAQDEAGIKKSQLAIDELIQHVSTAGIPTHRIIVGGFSQGGALALHVALRYPEKLAGAVGLSTYLPLADLLAHERQIINEKIPIFLGHGTQDFIVPYRFGQITSHRLQALQYPIAWHSYNMPHSVNEQEIKDLSDWLQQVLGHSN